MDLQAITQPRWWQRPAVLLALAAVLHFAISILIWLLATVLTIHWQLSLSEWIELILKPAWPCVVLLLLSIACLERAARRWRGAWPMLTALALLTALMLADDLIHQRYQMTAWWLTGSTDTHYYFTWWWLDDRWLG